MDSYSDAVQLLVQARSNGVPLKRLPIGCRPASLEDALEIQHGVGEALGLEIGGWKCGLPSVDKLVIAPIYASAIHRQSPCAVQATLGCARIEPEIGFIIGQDLPPRTKPYSEEEVRNAISGVCLALELIGTRYEVPETLSFPELLADGLFNQGLFLGPEIEDGLCCDLGCIPLVLQGALQKEIDGQHPNADPFVPLHWLANFLSSRGEGLKAGQVVITGSYAGVIDVPLGQTLTLRYGSLGQVDFQAEKRAA